MKHEDPDGTPPELRISFGKGGACANVCTVRMSALVLVLKERRTRNGVVSADGATAVRYAVIRFGPKSRGTPIPENDIWIAALALQYRLPVFSRDRHFSFIPEIRHIIW